MVNERISEVSVRIVEVPLVSPVSPYASRYRSSSATRSAVVRIETSEGLVGWGEHNVNFLPDVSAGRMEQEATDWLAGRGPFDLRRFHAECPLETRLKSGVELALCDLLGKRLGVPVWALMAGKLRDEIELAACMGLQQPERAAEIALSYVELGYSTLKMKGGAGIRADVAMVRAVREAVGDRLRLRLDPNCGYSRDESLELARALEPLDLEYLEQPLPESPIADAAWLKSRTSTPIALNESVTDPASAWEILKQDAAAFLLPDTPQAGGLLPCVEIGSVAAAAGVPCIMHCGHDLGLKTAAMLHAAAALPAYGLANDSTYYALERDILDPPLVISRGRIAVPDGPGWGVEVDEAEVRRRTVAGPT